jgi:hypothetical protein
MDWQPMNTAPRDGTWILAMNNRGNCAVIIWHDSAPSHLGYGPGWIHPFSNGELSTFWNGANGSLPVLWAALPTREEKTVLIGDDVERARLTRIETDTRNARHALRARVPEAFMAAVAGEAR